MHPLSLFVEDIFVGGELQVFLFFSESKAIHLSGADL